MKKLIIVVPIMILIVGLLSWMIVNNNRKNYYQNLKDNIQDDIERVLYLISPQCSVGSIQGSIVFEESQNDYYLVDKKKLLDIDGKSYCKIKVNPRCVSDGKLEWDTYIKCKNYQDKGYEDDK